MIKPMARHWIGGKWLSTGVERESRNPRDR